MKENIIPVVFSTDYNYIVPTGVAIISLLESAGPGTYYKVFVLAGNKKTDVIESVLKDIETQYENCTVELVRVKDEHFKNAVIVNDYLSIATYYRLVISDILREYPKCIYLDGDILILKDLTELYKEDIEQFYIGGVKAWNMYRQSGLTDSLQKELNIPVVNSYINAGVLLFNLKKIREDGLKEKFLEYVDRGLLYEDQDILNMCCYPSLKHLPERYNIYSVFYRSPLALFEFMDEVSGEVREQVMDPVIIHFSGMYVKPWENSRCRGAELWYSHVKKINSIFNLFQANYNPFAGGTKYNWDKLLNYCRNQDSILIWGFVERNKLLCDRLENRNVRVTGFIDNNTSKQFSVYKDKKVFPVNGIPDRMNSGIIITNSRYVAEMKKQLVEEGISTDRAYIYEIPSGWYYMGLDPAFYDEEVRDILEIEDVLASDTENLSFADIRESLLKKSVSDNRLTVAYRFDLWLFR